MPDALSQQDIDALLDNFSAEKESQAANKKAAASAHSSAISPDGRIASSYDFSHPELLSRDQVRSLRTLHEGYAQALAKRLSTELLTNVSAAVVSVEQLTYGEFLQVLPTPTVLAVIEVPVYEGNIAIEMNPGISFTFIDRLLGGVGQPMEQVRTLTAIEQGLMERVLTKCCNELSSIWAPIAPLQFVLQSIEGNPELARVVGPNEMVVLISLELRMGEITGMMNLCLPYVVMESAIHRLGHATSFRKASPEREEVQRKALETSVQQAKVRLDVDLGSVELTLEEVLRLETGDVLRVRSKGDAPALGSWQECRAYSAVLEDRAATWHFRSMAFVRKRKERNRHEFCG